MFLCGVGDEAVAIDDCCYDEMFLCAVGDEEDVVMMVVITMVAMTRCFCVA